jgi:DNA gyrase subunit A
MVQRTSVRGINRYGRASQGVRVMNIRDDDQVSAVALVIDSEATAAPVIGDEPVVLGDGTELAETFEEVEPTLPEHDGDAPGVE